ncbi:MAG: hypothetical protein AABZ15_03290 [Nitrospirota bacterium]
MDKKLPGIRKHSIIALSLFVLDAFILNQGVLSAGILFVALVSLAVMGAMMIFKKEREFLKRRTIIAVIYAVMALMVQGSNDLNNRVAMKHAGMIITACENYKNKHGAYPAKLSDLVPEFLNNVPPAKYTFASGNFRYSASDTKHDLMFVRFPPFGRPIYHFETKKWGYLD